MAAATACLRIDPRELPSWSGDFCLACGGSSLFLLFCFLLGSCRTHGQRSKCSRGRPELRHRCPLPANGGMTAPDFAATALGTEIVRNWEYRTQPAAMIAMITASPTTERHMASFSLCLPPAASSVRRRPPVSPRRRLDDPSQVRFRRDRPRWNPDERHSGRFDRLRLMRIGILAVRLCMRRIVKFDDSDDAKITPAQHEVGDELLKFTSNCLPIRGAGTNIDDLRQGQIGQDDAFRIHDT